LSGGGARGAYEAGVLDYVLGELPARLARPVRIDLILGSSVGAIHACYLAASADRGEDRTRVLRQSWLDMRMEGFLAPRARTWLDPRRLLGGRSAHAGNGSSAGLRRLVDTTALEALVRRTIPWTAIPANLARGSVRTLCIAATQLSTGRVMLFAEGRGVEHLRAIPDPSIAVVPCALRPEHALASAAIPGLFPPIRLDGEWYVDGGLRLNTPLAPAVHLGADRILVIGLRTAGEPVPPPASPPGGTLSIYAKMVNALMLDHLESDLARMRFVNQILRQGEAAFGADFLDRLAGSAPDRRRLRIVDELVIRPSRDPSRLASEALREKLGAGGSSTVVRALLGLVGRLPGSEGELLSYLLFDRTYTELLFDLGRADARAREDDLAAFFTD
jgi:NTE family protein